MANYNCANLTTRRLSKVSVINDKQQQQQQQVICGRILNYLLPTPLSRRVNLIRNL